MELKKKYDDLPLDIKEKTLNGNVFFTKEYEDYVASTGASVWYVYDQEYLLSVNVSEKIKIKQGLYVSEPLCFGKDYSARRQADFLGEVSKRLGKEGIAWVSTSAAALFDVYPDDSQRIPFGSYIIDLSQTEEELLMNMHSKHRNSVRRAEKNGVTVVSGGRELISDYLKTDAETWERSGRDSYGKAFFEKIIDNLKDNTVLYVAYKDGQPQAGACYFFNSQMCYYMYGASLTNPEPGAANLLQWIAIKDMKSKGIERFSFVGCRINEEKESKYHGIQRFKARFGGELCQGYMFKCVLSIPKYTLFRKMYHLKKKTALYDVFDQEIHKWPELQKVVITDD